MIKFFRNIRKNLITQGKTGKYLKYAIGKIVFCSVRSNILVAIEIKTGHRAFRYDI